MRLFSPTGKSHPPLSRDDDMIPRWLRPAFQTMSTKGSNLLPRRGRGKSQCRWALPAGVIVAGHTEPFAYCLLEQLGLHSITSTPTCDG